MTVAPWTCCGAPAPTADQEAADSYDRLTAAEADRRGATEFGFGLLFVSVLFTIFERYLGDARPLGYGSQGITFE